MISAADGSGSFAAYCATPAVRGPGIVVVQEIFGVTQNLRRVADDLAQAGYVALVPDLFWRLQPGVDLGGYTDAERDQGLGFLHRLDDAKALDDLRSTVAHLRAMPECTGEVGAIGFCLGGRLVFLLIQDSDIACGVSYYPSDVHHTLGDPARITKPLMIHVGTEDHAVPREAQEILRKLSDENPATTMHGYEGVGHAFARRDSPPYRPDAANLADERTAGFLSNHLRTPVGR
jgi:carboxymethylenebutenolidase